MPPLPPPDTVTELVLVLVAPLLSVTVSDTLYVPAAAYVWLGFVDVDVLLSVKQDVSSAGVKEKRTDYVSVSMTMRKVGDRWLAAEVLLAGADGKRGK